MHLVIIVLILNTDLKIIVNELLLTNHLKIPEF
jgi:hypothetical protein